MGPCTAQLFDCHNQRGHTQHPSHGLCRPNIVSNHARWFGSTAPSWFWVVWFDPPRLEAGTVTVSLAVSL